MAVEKKAATRDEGTATSKPEFIEAAGISPELAEFVCEFVKRPELFSSLTRERRSEIEAQMDAVLASFYTRGSAPDLNDR